LTSAVTTAPKRAADHDGHGQVDHVAAHHELLETL
jgi:hypothetical protein